MSSKEHTSSIHLFIGRRTIQILDLFSLSSSLRFVIKKINRPKCLDFSFFFFNLDEDFENSLVIFWYKHHQSIFPMMVELKETKDKMNTQSFFFFFKKQLYKTIHKVFYLLCFRFEISFKLATFFFKNIFFFQIIYSL